MRLTAIVGSRVSQARYSSSGAALMGTQNSLSQWQRHHVIPYNTDNATCPSENRTQARALLGDVSASRTQVMCASCGHANSSVHNAYHTSTRQTRHMRLIIVMPCLATILPCFLLKLPAVCVCRLWRPRACMPRMGRTLSFSWSTSRSSIRPTTTSTWRKSVDCRHLRSGPRVCLDKTL